MAAPNRGDCAVLAPPGPLARFAAGTATMRLAVAAPMTLVWADGLTDTYSPGTNGAVASLYDPTGATTTFDGHGFVWIVLASHGTPHLWAVKEVDELTAGSLLGSVSGAGEYAPLYRVDGDSISKMWQLDTSSFISLGPGVAAGLADGDLLTYDATSGTWHLIHLPASPAAPGYTYTLDWNGTAPAQWRQAVNWKNRAAPSIATTYTPCTGGSVAGQATNGTINLTMSGSLSGGTATSVLIADLTYASAYASIPTVLLTCQRYPPNILYAASVSATGFSLHLCDPESGTETLDPTLLINYAIIPT